MILQAPVRAVGKDLPAEAERVQIRHEVVNQPHVHVATGMIQSQDGLQSFLVNEGRAQKIFQNLREEGNHLAGEINHLDFLPAVISLPAGLGDHAHAMTGTTLHPDGPLNFQAKEEKDLRIFRNLHGEGNLLAEEINHLDFLPEVINPQGVQAGRIPALEMIVETRDQLAQQNFLARKETQKSLQSLEKENMIAVRRNAPPDFQNHLEMKNHLIVQISLLIRRDSSPS